MYNDTFDEREDLYQKYELNYSTPSGEWKTPPYNNKRKKSDSKGPCANSMWGERWLYPLIILALAIIGLAASLPLIGDSSIISTTVAYTTATPTTTQFGSGMINITTTTSTQFAETTKTTTTTTTTTKSATTTKAAATTTTTKAPTTTTTTKAPTTTTTTMEPTTNHSSLFILLEANQYLFDIDTGNMAEQSSFTVGADTYQGRFACSVNYKNQMMLFGAKASATYQQISVVTQNKIEKIGTLTKPMNS